MTALRHNFAEIHTYDFRQSEAAEVLGLKPLAALRKVEIESADYAYQEYGLTQVQVEEAGQRISAQIKRERRAGTIKEFKGDWRELRG